MISTLMNRTLNGVVIEQTEHFVLSETESSYSLRIEEAALTDAGQFKLKLSNLLGEEVKSAPVTVHRTIQLHDTSRATCMLKL